MSVCEHDPYCPGYGDEHDIAMKGLNYGHTTIAPRLAKRLDESVQAFKRRERAERKLRGDRA